MRVDVGDEDHEGQHAKGGNKLENPQGQQGPTDPDDPLLCSGAHNPLVTVSVRHRGLGT